MNETTPGREIVQIVELVQPFCANTFGSAPCTATGTGATKCYNTRATCQDTVNFALGTPLSLFFSRGNVADRGVVGAPYIIPSLLSVSTAPTKINLAVSDRNSQGLGQRALCTIVFQDHPHTDRRVDPYVDERPWDPMSADRGSFWSRWLVRNRYRQNIEIKVYEGYAGQTLAEMKMRRYFLSDVSQVSADGRVTIRGKDILARVEERKAQAPQASPGLLFTGINASATSFLVANAVIDDYPASGTLRINSEIMTYTGRSTSGDNVLFTGVTRGRDNTVADAHDVDDAVQECLRYTAQPVDTLLTDLLTTWGGIDPSWLDTANWATEVGTYLSFYDLTALITEPQSVSKLISEIQEQALCFLWWDERESLIKLRAVRGIDEQPDLLTEGVNVIATSVTFTEKPKERASQVWVYYNQNDFTEDEDKPKSYKSQFVIANLESETDELYGEPSIRKIYGRWLPSDALAQNTASKIITRYVDVPAQIRFRLDAKDRNYWVGDTVEIEHFRDVDQYGEKRRRFWMITSAEEKRPGELIEYVAEDTTLYGRINYIMADSAPDYPGAASAPFRNCYIGDASGLLSDGSPSGRIL
ncbi:MAG: hypothetical protein AAFX90_10075 [Pseudomonadota bacterium]